MKKITLSFSFLLASILSFCQTSPSLIIDGKAIKFESDISLPYWLDAGKTISLGANAASVSILEFTIDSNNLIYNKTIHLTAISSVPNGKTWKIESIGVGKNPNYPSMNGFTNDQKPSIFTSPYTFSIPGAYTWTVPPGITSICVELWGPGGRGDNNCCGRGSRGGGAGGGYGYECIAVTPGQNFSVRIGSGKVSFQDTTFFDTLFATGGQPGGNSIAQGGSSNAKFNIRGENGGGVTASTYANLSKGGNGANGGLGSESPNSAYDSDDLDNLYPNGWSRAAQIPGGGGGLLSESNGEILYGASGQIKIYF
jgi:hypothetical protein